MELIIRVDHRENCFASVSPHDMNRFGSKIARSDDPTCFLYLVEDPKTEQGTIVIGKEFAKCLNLFPSSSVNFRAVDTPRKNAMIIVSPASVDDWEVVESQAQFLEATILSQVKVVFPGLIFPVWTGRGQRPIFLKVQPNEDDEFLYQILEENTELAVEARKRTKLESFLPSGQKGVLPLRVIDSGFPVNEASLLGVGVIINQDDFMHAFGPHSGCLMTIRDRPDILSLVACDSTIVDRGVALVAPWMRDQYGLLSGERIVLENDSVCSNNSNLIMPSKVFAYFPSSVPVCARKGILERFLKQAECLIVPQGGWIGVPESGGNVQFRFGSEIPASKAGAILSYKYFHDLFIDCSLAVPDVSPQPQPKPYLKYVPEPIRADADRFGVIRRHSSAIALTPIPSFSPMITRISKYFESTLRQACSESPFVGSVLLSAASPGTGRTTAMLQAIDSLSPSIFSLIVNCRALADASRFKLTDVVSALTGLVRFAFENPPCCLFFDDIDSLIPTPSNSGENAEFPSVMLTESSARALKRGKIITEHLTTLIRDLQPNRSIILAATALGDSPALAKLFTHYERVPLKLTDADRACICPMAYKDGVSLMELVEATADAGVENRERRRQAMSSSKAVVSKSFALGGLDTQIKQLEDAITLPLKFPSLFTGVSGHSIVPSGAFVVGPSGTGKSAMIDHVVRLTNLPVEVVRGPDLLDKYIGASEQGVRRVFEKAAAMAPCVVVFDTIDALCPRRGSESTGVTDRVVNQMLCYLDGVDKVENVFVVAVSSRPDMVDPALIRPGRLDLTILCDIPSKSERSEIIQAIACEFGMTLKEEEIEQLNAVVAKGVTGADIRAAFVNAQIISARSNANSTFNLLSDCMREIKPSISERDAKIYDKVFSKYRGSKDEDGFSTRIGTKVMLH